MINIYAYHSVPDLERKCKTKSENYSYYCTEERRRRQLKMQLKNEKYEKYVRQEYSTNESCKAFCYVIFQCSIGTNYNNLFMYPRIS